MVVYYYPELIIMYTVPVMKFTRVCVIHVPAMANVAKNRRPPSLRRMNEVSSREWLLDFVYTHT